LSKAQPTPLPDITVSNQLFERARHLIPAGTQTLAKGPTQHVRGVAPKYLRRGRGAHVVDVDGNKFLDFSMAIGPLSLGYGHPEVDGAIRAQLNDGITFSLMHPLEVEVAELVSRTVPGAEMVRFSKTGADVTSAAIRLARAFTGRSKVLACGYHGWHDWYIATTDRQKGIPPEIAALTHTFAYNDLASVEAALDHDTAAVILEPMVFEEPRDGFLEELLRLCHARGALLIFDEMWTGFRCALGGAQERFGVTADLACFSKAIANGMPLAALTGRADVMRMLDKDVFFFTTFGGEALSLAAAKATIEVMQRDDVTGHLDRTGGDIKRRYNALATSLGIDYSRCIGLGCRSLVTFEATGKAAGQDPLLMKSLVQQELFRRGVLWAGFHNVSFAHGPAEVDHLMEAYRHALGVLHEALAHNRIAKMLAGDPVEPVFRKVANFHTKPVPLAAVPAERASRPFLTDNHGTAQAR
jgi:glutamate-1-semialdehyde 2,1-aminomutase